MQECTVAPYSLALLAVYSALLCNVDTSGYRMCRALLYASESLPVSSGTVSFHRHSSTVAHYTSSL